MRDPNRRGFVTPLNLVVILATLGLCVLAYLGLGRLGWAWWIRIPAVIAGLYALAFGLMFLGGWIEERKKGP